MRIFKLAFPLFLLLFVSPMVLTSVEGRIQAFSFIIYSDIQIGYSESLDLYGNNNTLRYLYLVDTLNYYYPRWSFDFALNLGDNVCGNGSDRGQWNIWGNVTQNIRYPVYHVKGNHDGTSLVTNFEEYTGNNVNYYFDYSSFRFLFVGTEELFRFNGSCGLNLTGAQKDFIRRAVDGQDRVWLVSHFPTRMYWSDLGFFDEISPHLVGYSGGHEDQWFDIENLGYININMQSVCMYKGFTDAILPFVYVTVDGNNVEVDLYDAYTMCIIHESNFDASNYAKLYASDKAVDIEAYVELNPNQKIEPQPEPSPIMLFATATLSTVIGGAAIVFYFKKRHH
jgi:hypothetical protein